MSEIQAIKQRFGIIGTSFAIENVLQTAVRVAPTDLSVLIIGESGVGKEAFSQIIHHLSARKHGQFIAINCGAIPEGTINSELFGHEKGSFTGAADSRKGYFETVNNGTIFLDEIGEMPLDTQSLLLRVLENGEFFRVGSSKAQKTDVRIVAATNVNLAEAIKTKKFREDLYYRLATVPIYVPALRERREDIYLLFRKFAADFAEKYRTHPIQLDEEARQILENYAWPGNIRQLKNITEQISVLSQKRLLTAKELSQFLPNSNIALSLVPVDKNNPPPLEEREILYKLLFEMKKDLNDLKSLVFQLIQDNNLQVNTSNEVLTSFSMLPAQNHYTPNKYEPEYTSQQDVSTPIILDSSFKNSDKTTKSMDNPHLSIEEMEKEMIKKALRKFRNRRKDAADELGISERTLYRKIRQYNITI
jgi:DNA-binding NtrC family response regulator